MVKTSQFGILGCATDRILIWNAHDMMLLSTTIPPPRSAQIYFLSEYRTTGFVLALVQTAIKRSAQLTQRCHKNNNAFNVHVLSNCGFYNEVRLYILCMFILHPINLSRRVQVVFSSVSCWVNWGDAFIGTIDWNNIELRGRVILIVVFNIGTIF